jgi:hypothetical protein
MGVSAVRWQAHDHRSNAHIHGGAYTWYAWYPVVAENFGRKTWVWREYVKCRRVPRTYRDAYGGTGTGYEYVYEVMDHQPGQAR